MPGAGVSSLHSAELTLQMTEAASCGRGGDRAVHVELGERLRAIRQLRRKTLKEVAARGGAQRELPEPARARPHERDDRVAAAARDRARDRRLRPLRAGAPRPRVLRREAREFVAWGEPRPQGAPDAEAVPLARGRRRALRARRLDRRRAVHARRLGGAPRRRRRARARAARRRRLRARAPATASTTGARRLTASRTPATRPPR